jgi:hypothetical protein
MNATDREMTVLCMAGAIAGALVIVVTAYACL